MSFLRHWEIYQVSESNSGDRELKGRDLAATPVAHQLDESPVGYSLAGCSPAEPASASPTEATLQQCRGELQEGIGWNLDPTLTRGLTLGAHPTSPTFRLGDWPESRAFQARLLAIPKPAILCRQLPHFRNIIANQRSVN